MYLIFIILSFQSTAFISTKSKNSKRKIISSTIFLSPNSSNTKSLYPLKDKFRCFFCGGKKCPHEDYTTHKNPAIIGLNSDLIDGNIFASQRPSNTLIKNFDLIQRFKEKNIGLIINLQRPGEHPYCGPNKLEPLSGYSYNPSLFSSEGIEVKLCGWKDMDVPDSLYFMLEIVKEMHNMINYNNKKVLIHCHAGYGRTGVVIACYKIFDENITAEDAVKNIRAIRPRCIEQKSQMSYCKKFSQFISGLREVFKIEQIEINTILKNQNDLSSKNASSKYELYIPKLMNIICNKIIKLFKSKQKYDIDLYKALNGTYELSDKQNETIFSIITNINMGNWRLLEELEDIQILGELLFIWLDESVNFCINPLTIKKLFENNNEILKGNLFDLIVKSNEGNLSQLTLIYSYIKTILKKYEWEIIKFYVKFIKEIFPNSDNPLELHEYEKMTEKFCIYLLGFNFEKFYYKNNINTDKNKQIALIEDLDILQKFVILTEFIENTFQNSLVKTIFDSNMDLYYMTPRNGDDISLIDNKKKNDIIEHFLSNKTPKWFDLYKVLKNHFEGQEEKTNIKDDLIPSVKIYSDNSSASRSFINSNGNNNIKNITEILSMPIGINGEMSKKTLSIIRRRQASKAIRKFDNNENLQCNHPLNYSNLIPFNNNTLLSFNDLNYENKNDVLQLKK